jgi:hypothetical protein
MSLPPIIPILILLISPHVPLLGSSGLREPGGLPYFFVYYPLNALGTFVTGPVGLLTFV